MYTAMYIIASNDIMHVCMQHSLACTHGVVAQLQPMPDVSLTTTLLAKGRPFLTSSGLESCIHATNCLKLLSPAMKTP